MCPIVSEALIVITDSFIQLLGTLASASILHRYPCNGDQRHLIYLQSRQPSPPRDGAFLGHWKAESAGLTARAFQHWK